jgi:phosphohistidine phosphatase
VRLYLLRHGVASRSAWSGPDADRPLTPEGEETVACVGKRLADAGVQVDLVLTSPYARAVRTAEMVAAALGVTDRLAEEPRLASGFGPSELRDVLREHAALDAIMLVGHEPDFSEAIAYVTGGGRVVMKKAGLARVDLDEAGAASGTLVWLVPPGALPR